MQPAAVQGQPIASPQPTVSPQGVAAPAPNGVPTPPVLPQGQTPVATPAPVATPNFNTSGALNDIAQYYGIPRQTAAVAGAGQALGAVAQSQFEAQKAENQIKIQNQQNQLNPDAYQTVKNKDGTVTIYNSMGDKVDIGTLANLTGADPAQFLQKAGATDPASEKYIAAATNLQNYAQVQIAAHNGDAQAQAELQDYYKANPGLATGGPNGGPMELGQLQVLFMQQYGDYYGMPQQGTGGGNLAKGVTPTISSVNNPASTSAYENPTYQELLGGGTAYQPSPAAGGTSTSGGLAAALAGLESQQTSQ